MQWFWNWWQHIPTMIDPVAFRIGSLPVYWYALFFLTGSYLTYYFCGRVYIKRKIFSQQEYQDFAFGVFLAALIGGKIGFLALYWWPFTGALWPTSAGSALALPGMSFVGGMVGVAGYLFWHTKKNKKNFFAVADVLAFLLPLAIFFGRLGNFFHGELKGRVTEHIWGMYFVGDNVLRHPSTLYAALFEGLVLFVVILFLSKKEKTTGFITACFCILYGGLRFLSEYFREPDAQIGYVGVLTLNQIFALIIMVLGILILAVRKRKNLVQ